MFLTDTKQLNIEPIDYGVMIKLTSILIPTSLSPHDNTGNTTDGTNTTAMPTSSSSGPTVLPVKPDETSDEYNITVSVDSTETVKHFTGSSFNLTESMQPCTTYMITVATIVNGTSCLVGTKNVTTMKLSKLSYTILYEHSV